MVSLRYEISETPITFDKTMLHQDYIYQDRIVAFVDVLGYREKLSEFEADATLKVTVEGDEILVSEKVNEFLSTFRSITHTLDERNMRYYLFSDNICITADYVQNPELLIDIPLVIIDLFYEFAIKGYFLRGAIEVGKFIDEDKIALGKPLSLAYMAETTKAVYPRILVSHEYNIQLQEYLTGGENNTHDPAILDQLILHNCEYYFLNPFYLTATAENKVDYLTKIRGQIVLNLEANSKKESLYTKYEWLARQFNRYLDRYTSELIFTEQDAQDEETINQLKLLKIIHDGL